MRRLAALLNFNLCNIRGKKECGPNGSKQVFLNVGKVFLRALARDLGLHDVTVSSNAGGIGVSGDCNLIGMWENGGLYSITSKVSDGIVKCVAEFESNRGDLMMRVTSYAMENTIAVEERDESSRCYSKGNVDYYIISNNDQVKISWQIGLNAYVIGGQISENEAKEIIDSIT